MTLSKSVQEQAVLKALNILVRQGKLRTFVAADGVRRWVDAKSKPGKLDD